MFTETVSISAAFTAGLFSFLSPCVLPVIPAYFSFITGLSLDELTGGELSGIRRKVVLSTISFICGFSLVFILMGASASFLGGVISEHRHFIEVCGGLVIIIFGLHLTGWLRITPLQAEKRIHLREKPLHVMGAFVAGTAFAAGWSPCIGPMLGTILIMAGSRETVWQGVWLLSVYASGLALPFLLVSVFINYLLAFTRKASGYMRLINLAGGLLLVLAGIFLLTRNLSILKVFETIV